MLENIFIFLKEHANETGRIDIDSCLTLISQYLIEHENERGSLPNLNKELQKFIFINSRRCDTKALQIWWSQYKIEEKKELLAPHLHVDMKKNVVILPKAKRTHVSLPSTNIPIAVMNKYLRLEETYDNLIASRNIRSNEEKPTHIWQWAINQEEYQNICTAVEVCKDLTPTEKRELVNYRDKCIFIIVAYIAERYKREWNGNDGEENALIQIGLEDKAEEIAKAYFGDRSERYIFRHNNGTGPHEYLESMRMEGGLPINYIVNDIRDNNNHLVDFCEKLYEDSTEAVNILNNRINNSCLRYSYERQHSIYHYVCALLAENAIANMYGTDAENVEQIKTFAELLLNGRGKAQRKSHKFAMDYSVWRWKGSDEFVLHQNVVFKSDSSFNETPDLISRERLEQWGINPSYIFWLKIGNRLVEFHPWKKDFYRPAVGNTRIPLDDIDLSSHTLPKISFGYIGQTKDGKKDMEHIRAISRPLVPHKEPYIKFSSDDGHRWHQNGSGAFSAVLITSPAEVEGADEELELDGGMQWVEYTGQLKINGQYIYSSNNIIVPEIEAKHSIANQSWIRNIQLINDGTAEPIHILDPSKVISKNFKKVNYNGTSSKVIGRIEYKNNETSRFTSFNCDNPPLGLTTLRMDGIRMKAYLYPDGVRAIRDIGNNFVSLKGIKASQVEIQENDHFYTVNPTGDWKAFDRYNSDNKQSDSIPIIIHNEDGTDIAMEIIRPLNRKDRILSSIVLDSNQQIPKRLASQFRVREFNEDGVTYHKDRTCVQRYSNRQIELRSMSQGQFYVIANGKNITLEENLHFAFWAIDGTICNLSIKSGPLDFSRRDIYYYYLDGIPSHTPGYIIQTLKYGRPKLTFYKPLWTGTICKPELFRTSISHLDRFLGCIEHGLYFGGTDVYDFFVAADFKYLSLEELLRQYIKHCQKKNIEINFKAIWEIAGDFNKDWLMVPRPYWRNICQKFHIDEKIITVLLSHRPIDEQCNIEQLFQYLTKFWSYYWGGQRTSRRSPVERIFLRYIMAGEATNGCPIPTSLPNMTDILAEMYKD